MSLLNGILLGLAIIGAARVALREKSVGWWLLVSAFMSIYVHGAADRDMQAAIAAQFATIANVLLLIGMVLIYHGHREQMTDAELTHRKQIDKMMGEVSVTIRALELAQKQLRGEHHHERT